MGFTANYKSIQRFGEKLNELVGDSREAGAYAEKWLSFGYSEGRMFISAVEAAENAKQALSENYQRLAEIQHSAASEVDKAAHSYEQVDRGEAARLDNSYRKQSD